MVDIQLLEFVELLVLKLDEAAPALCKLSPPRVAVRFGTVTVGEALADPACAIARVLCPFVPEAKEDPIDHMSAADAAPVQ